MTQSYDFVKGINHLGMTVPDIEAATTFFKTAFGAKWAYDGLTESEEPRGGAEVEQQLGLPTGVRIVRQRMLVIGVGPGIELFEMQGEPQEPAVGLADFGLNHLSLYVTDIERAKQSAEAAGAKALSAVHGNSRYEDTPGNGSVYVSPPWGGLIELQTIPQGHYYPAASESQVWSPLKESPTEK